MVVHHRASKGERPLPPGSAAAATELRAVVGAMDLEARDPAAPSARPVRRSLAMRGVGFAYPDGPPVLRGVDLEVEAGERLCVVGPTGAGKSTLLALLLRFYDPTAGAIELDGTDLRDLELDSLRRQVALVPQDPPDARRRHPSNIAFGRPSAG